MSWLKRLPLPVCGVMLGLAALGNLLQAVCANLLGIPAVGTALRGICGLLATLLFLALLFKLINFFDDVRQGMQNPVIVSVSGTFPMALMLLSAYWKPTLGGAAKWVWLFAVALHAVLIVWFSLKFLRHPQLKLVFPSYFIIYVGIAVAAVSAPAYGMEALGAATFWFGLICLIALLVPVTARCAKLPMDESAKPLFCIYAAPASLCLAGYVQSVQPKSYGMVLGLLIVSSAILVAVLFRLPSLLKLPFYPSYAAFTFPFVITAISALQAMSCLKALGHPMPWMRCVVLLETLLAAVLVFYALVRYLTALAARKTPAQKI